MATNRQLSRLKIYLVIFLSVIVLGIVGFMVAEDLSFLDAVYYSIVTISTVGYGDITPQSPWGKLLTLIIIFTGAGTFVSVVALATDTYLDGREQASRNRKIQMLIGLFYSEVGTDLLARLVKADSDPTISVQSALHCEKHWQDNAFDTARQQLEKHTYIAEAAQMDLVELNDFLQQNQQLVIRLMESPYLLEHNAFSDLLIAFLHLKEELAHRPTLTDLPQNDLHHLTGDIERVYRQLAQQWLDYLIHLQQEYPFLYALAVRTNPFNPKATVVVD